VAVCVKRRVDDARTGKGHEKTTVKGRILLPFFASSAKVWKLGSFLFLRWHLW
jgi:hypothetical protein